MNGAHILLQLWNGPSHICDISTRDGCNFQSDTPHPSLLLSPTYTLFSLSRSLASLLSFPTHALFWFSTVGYFMLSVPPASRLSSHFSPHLLPFCSFLAIRHFFFSSPSLHTFMSHLIAFFLFRGLSHPELPFCFCLLIHHLSSHLLNLSTRLYLCLLSAVTPASHLGLFYLSLSVSPSSVFSCSLPLYFPQQLCFVWHPADKAADKGEREHI